ncbi:MAG: YdeI/OmpD-associated family protein [Anaerolineae bacterium]|nr:YdeI/OmpD-associated family protein [Anaerolineae bacterium]MCA9889519.1 YdeI/OmpD-associated family protein [Anaerolineae bacterium]MCA9892856.1 YdeI/OmpD-associated family protein [Anaerolineae bacterium]
MAAELEQIIFETQADWEAWLEANHKQPDGIWMQLAKKDSEKVSQTYDEALEIALCFGWIDGQKKGFDDDYWLQKFTPRRKRSKWSQRNVDIVGRLMDAGKIREAGLAEIEAAKADGRWEAAYEGSRKMEVPDDFTALLATDPEAQAFFEQLDSANRYSMLYQIQDAKKPETRQKRIQKFFEMCQRKEKKY